MGRAAIRTAVATVAAGTLIALAGCGSSSKPAYCTDRTNLENSIKNLPSVTSSSGVSGSEVTAHDDRERRHLGCQLGQERLPESDQRRQDVGRRAPERRQGTPVEPFSQPDRRDRTQRQKRRELGQELLRRQQVEVQLTRQSAIAGRSACRLLAWPSARHPCSDVGAAQPSVALGGDHERDQDRGKQSDDESPRPAETFALRCFRCWNRAARRWC